MGKYDTIKMHGIVKNIDGETIESSYDDVGSGSAPIKIVVGQTKNILCFNEGLLGLKVGARVDLICPPDYAFGIDGYGAIVPNQTLIY